MISADYFGAGARFHHVGIAVRSIEAVNLALEIHADPIQGVRVAFFETGGMTLELVEPGSGRSPVSESLEKGVKLLHLCFEVDDLSESLAHCKERGFTKISSPAPAVAFGGRRIVWVYSPVLGLVELLESG